MSESMVERVVRVLQEIDPEISPIDGRTLARAAIEAMREPTEAMIEEGQAQYKHWNSTAVAVWRAMLWAALEPKG